MWPEKGKGSLWLFSYAYIAIFRELLDFSPLSKDYDTAEEGVCRWLAKCGWAYPLSLRWWGAESLTRGIVPDQTF